MFSLRNFKSESDFSEMAAVICASSAADNASRQVDAEDLATAYDHMSNCDPYRDVIVAEVDGRMVGYVRGWWEEGVDNERWYCHNGFLTPTWRRKGIGHSLLVAIEGRLREIAAEHPAQLNKLFQVSVNDQQPGSAALLEHSGYLAERYFFLMVRLNLDDIPDVPLPDGIETRKVHPAQFPAIWQALVATSREEWGHKELTDADYREWLASPQFQPELWQVAWDIASGQVVGLVLTYINREENKQFNRQRGYTEGIGVLPAWRRRGIARALIYGSLLVQKDAGMSESALVVDSENLQDATRLYESCGFQIVKRDTLYRKPLNT